jgi:hypothetical protein
MSNNAFSKINDQYLNKDGKVKISDTTNDTQIPHNDTIHDTMVSNIGIKSDTSSGITISSNTQTMNKLCKYIKSISSNAVRTGRTFRVEEKLFDKKFKPYLRLIEDLKIDISANEIYILAFLFVSECYPDEFIEIVKENYKVEDIDL